MPNASASNYAVAPDAFAVTARNATAPDAAAPDPRLDDYMTFFPIVVPRFIFAAAREIAAGAYKTYFDAAWHSIRSTHL